MENPEFTTITVQGESFKVPFGVLKKMGHFNMSPTRTEHTLNADPVIFEKILKSLMDDLEIPDECCDLANTLGVRYDRQVADRHFCLVNATLGDEDILT